MRIMKQRIYLKPDAWTVNPYEEVMINPANGSWRVVKSDDDDYEGWFTVIEEDDWDDDDYLGANDSFFDD